MPSHLHEALSLLFRNRPALAPELLRDALHVALPEYTEVRIDSLPEVARRALQAMNASKYEYQSEFARRYYGQGKADGLAAGVTEGVVKVVLRQLATRYGALPPAVTARVRGASTEDL